MSSMEHGLGTAPVREAAAESSSTGFAANATAELQAPAPASAPAATDYREQPAAEAARQQTDSVEKIRDILFGSNMRDYDRRFAQLEERLIRSAGELTDEMAKRLSSLEIYVRKEVETLAEELRSEKGDRTAGAETITRTMSDLGATLERRAQQLGEHATRIQRELRQQMLEQHTALADDDRKNREDLHAALTRHFDELHDTKVDRDTIADLFSELSGRLKGTLRLPSTEGK